MEDLKRENEPANIKSILVVILLISIIAGCLIYIFNLRNNLSDTTEKLEAITSEKELVEAQLIETEENLETANENLSFANAEIERHVERDKVLTEEINRQAEEITNLSTELETCKNLVADENARWQRRYEEYSTATEVWVCMKALGWNDIVCSGIMGNLMAETGGSGTFNLDWDSDGSSGYGLVQWTGNRRKEIKNIYGDYPIVKEQIQFIHDELYGVNGVTRQVEQYQLDAIMEAETPEDCAYAFACYYERCDEDYRHRRSEYARWAYNYFVDDY